MDYLVNNKQQQQTNKQNHWPLKAVVKALSSQSKRNNGGKAKQSKLPLLQFIMFAFLSFFFCSFVGKSEILYLYCGFCATAN